MPRLQIIIASTRPGRAGLPIGTWMADRARAYGGFEVEVVDLAEVKLPFLDEPHHPMRRQYTKDHTRAWSALIERGEAYIFVTPEYNYAMPATLKNALDFLHHEWKRKPAAFVSYGGMAGGVRAVQMAKQVVTALGMMPVQGTVAIPFVNNLIKDGTFEPTEAVDRAAGAMLDELLELALALQPLRAGVVSAA